MPQTKFPQEEWEGFAPAPLDSISLVNGVRKFDHPQCLIETTEAQFALEYLTSLFPHLQSHSQLATDSEVYISLATHGDKAAGDPWCQLGAPDKEDAVDIFGLDQIEEFYVKTTPIIGATLKDELRPIGKDARFFRPADVSSYVEGARLFHHQNIYLSRAFESPIFCRFVTPGSALTRVFTSLRDFSPNIYSADGSQWDAHFPLVIASLISSFRSRYLPPERVQRYYACMYNGYTSVGGRLINLIGQPSGHFNTTIDNCLAHLCIMAIHAYRFGLTLPQFREEVLYYCCGDDLILSTRTNVFSPHNLNATYNSLEVYLEFENLEPTSIFKLPFCGVSPVTRTFKGMDFFGYYLSHTRPWASMRIHARESKPVDKLAKICSIAQLMFMNEKLFKLAVAYYNEVLVRLVADDLITLDNPNVRGHLAALDEQRLMTRYLTL